CLTLNTVRTTVSDGYSSKANSISKAKPSKWANPSSASLLLYAPQAVMVFTTSTSATKTLQHSTSTRYPEKVSTMSPNTCPPCPRSIHPPKRREQDKGFSWRLSPYHGL